MRCGVLRSHWPCGEEWNLGAKMPIYQYVENQYISTRESNRFRLSQIPIQRIQKSGFWEAQARGDASHDLDGIVIVDSKGILSLLLLSLLNRLSCSYPN